MCFEGSGLHLHASIVLIYEYGVFHFSFSFFAVLWGKLMVGFTIYLAHDTGITSFCYFWCRALMEVNPLLYVPEDMNVTIGTEQRAFFFFLGAQCVFWALHSSLKTMFFAQCFLGFNYCFQDNVLCPVFLGFNCWSWKKYVYGRHANILSDLRVTCIFVRILYAFRSWLVSVQGI